MKQNSPDWHKNTKIDDMPEFISLYFKDEIITVHKIKKWAEDEGAKLGFMENGHYIIILRNTIDKFPSTEEEYNQHH